MWNRQTITQVMGWNRDFKGGNQGCSYWCQRSEYFNSACFLVLWWHIMVILWFIAVNILHSSTFKPKKYFLFWLFLWHHQKKTFFQRVWSRERERGEEGRKGERRQEGRGEEGLPWNALSPWEKMHPHWFGALCWGKDNDSQEWIYLKGWDRERCERLRSAEKVSEAEGVDLQTEYQCEGSVDTQS